WGILFETLTETKAKLIRMANATGEYADIDKYRVYTPNKATSFQDPVVAIPYTGYKTLTDAEIQQKQQEGLVVLDMFGASPLNSRGALTATSALVTGLFR